MHLERFKTSSGVMDYLASLFELERLVYKLLTGPIVTVCCIRSRYSSQEVNVTTSLPPRPPPALSDLSIAMIYQSCISHKGA